VKIFTVATSLSPGLRRERRICHIAKVVEGSGYAAYGMNCDHGKGIVRNTFFGRRGTTNRPDLGPSFI
jgi:hypothetical protein